MAKTTWTPNEKQTRFLENIMAKLKEILADGEWHHLTNVASIYHAVVACRNGQLEKKEERVIDYLADGTEVIKTIVMFRLPDGKLN